MSTSNAARYFAAVVMGNRLHVGSGEGPWDSSRFDWWREDELDLILPKGYGEKVHTLEELECALKAPMKVAPTRQVWIHESLEGDARRLWEEVGSRVHDDATVPPPKDP